MAHSYPSRISALAPSQRQVSTRRRAAERCAGTGRDGEGGGSASGMSMSMPLEPELGTPDEGIPAADPGAGAPPPAEGFGVGGEEPDRPEEAEGPDTGTAADGPEDPPFRTPDPTQIGPS